MSKYKIIPNAEPVFDPNIEDTSGMALAQMHAQGFRHVRGLGYVKLEPTPTETEIDPHDIEGYVFEVYQPPTPSKRNKYLPTKSRRR